MDLADYTTKSDGAQAQCNANRSKYKTLVTDTAPINSKTEMS